MHGRMLFQRIDFIPERPEVAQPVLGKVEEDRRINLLVLVNDQAAEADDVHIGSGRPGQGSVL